MLKKNKMENELTPNTEEVRKWLVSTLQHSCHVEYFLWRMGIGGEYDDQRPHDLVGPGNKFEWDVIKGFALDYREPKVDFKTYISPALDLHRQQYHHQKWNNPDPNNKLSPVVGASEDDMMVGAVDSVCSLLENRSYQGGIHDYDAVIEIAKKNPPHKAPWMLKVIPEMRQFRNPGIESIVSLKNFPNIGLDDLLYSIIQKRANETLEMLETRGYSF